MYSVTAPQKKTSWNSLVLPVFTNRQPGPECRRKGCPDCQYQVSDLLPQQTGTKHLSEAHSQGNQAQSWELLCLAGCCPSSGTKNAHVHVFTSPWRGTTRHIFNCKIASVVCTRSGAFQSQNRNLVVVFWCIFLLGT